MDNKQHPRIACHRKLGLSLNDVSDVSFNSYASFYTPTYWHMYNTFEISKTHFAVNEVNLFESIITMAKQKQNIILQ